MWIHQTKSPATHSEGEGVARRTHQTTLHQNENLPPINKQRFSQQQFNQGGGFGSKALKAAGNTVHTSDVDAKVEKSLV
jgi:hypothetical protein